MVLKLFCKILPTVNLNASVKKEDITKVYRKMEEPIVIEQKHNEIEQRILKVRDKRSNKCTGREIKNYTRGGTEDIREFTCKARITICIRNNAKYKLLLKGFIRRVGLNVDFFFNNLLNFVYCELLVREVQLKWHSQ